MEFKEQNKINKLTSKKKKGAKEECNVELDKHTKVTDDKQSGTLDSTIKLLQEQGGQQEQNENPKSKFTLGAIPGLIKQKLSGLDKNQFLEIEQMKKAVKAQAQIERLCDKYTQFTSVLYDHNNIKHNNYDTNAVRAAWELLNDVMHLDKERYDVQESVTNLKGIQVKFEVIKETLNEKIKSTKHNKTKNEIYETRATLKEIESIEKSMKKAAKDIGSYSR